MGIVAMYSINAWVEMWNVPDGAGRAPHIKGEIYMPSYVYACENCDAEIEVFQKITEEPLETLRHLRAPPPTNPQNEEELSCFGKVKRLIAGPVGFTFKGGAPTPEVYQ